MKIVHLNRWEDVARLKASWNLLVAKISGAKFFQTYEWNEVWRRCFGEGKKLLVLGAERDGDLVALLPLCSRGRFLNGRFERVWEFLGSSNREPDYCDISWRLNIPKRSLQLPNGSPCALLDCA